MPKIKQHKFITLCHKKYYCQVVPVVPSQFQIPRLNKFDKLSMNGKVLFNCAAAYSIKGMPKIYD